MSLLKEARRVAAEFEYTAEDVRKGVKEFMREMDEGLQKSGSTMSQIPTYVTAVPNGTEKGLYLAVDLGGTNFRVCSIQLHGNTTFSLTQSKVAIPRELMVAKTSKELFSFLAKQIENFLKTHHNDHFQAHIRRRLTMSAGEGYRDEQAFQLGFTFSFPVEQVGINKGYLIRWTKGFDIEDTVGKDVCALLQGEIDALRLPVKVAALVNDTVGTLMARSYTSPGKTGTLLGAIFGTGTNGAYVEKLSKITKMATMEGSADYDKSTGEMIVNTEWGSFDNHLTVLPKTPYDAALDKCTPNPGIQMFEKRISGMFLGEILRHAILALVRDPNIQLFADENSSTNDIHSTTTIADDSALYTPWAIDTSFLSIVQEDQSAGLRVTRHVLERDLGVSAASAEDAEAVKVLVGAIGKRAARLSAVAIGAIVLATGRLDENADSVTVTEEAKSSTAIAEAEKEVGEEDVIDIGVDGSVVEYYPGFEDFIREALREVPEIGASGERRIRIGIAKDGSGVGAALIALVAGGADGTGKKQVDAPAKKEAERGLEES
ncbi:MAG: glucokinase [Lasallia pustulata]|uniref:Phosphotransferase n=1 Tax=Lasallia pustulata TaxID=136370 RepID=A0A5M8PXC9_9LECA|nr:MAG: glucokinase [Lasallia pustulata]